MKWQDGYRGQHVSYISGTSPASTSLPPVTGHVGASDNRARRSISKLPEWYCCSDSQLSSRLSECREMTLPQLTDQTQLTTSRHPPTASTQQVTDSWSKHWSSELPAYNRKSWKQSTNSVSQTNPAVSMWTDNYQPKPSYQQPSTTTALRRSSSMRGPLTDAATPVVARKTSLSMDNLIDKDSVVIIILVCNRIHTVFMYLCIL